MEEKLKRLKATFAKIKDLQYAQAVLGWDQQTYMPAGSAEGRAEQLATLAELSHSLFVSPEVAGLLEDLTLWGGTLDPESDDACLLQVASRQFKKATRLSKEWVAEYARVTAVAQSVWEQARARNEFELFCPHLERIVALKREYASFYSPYDHIYDPLLDDFEPGLKTSEVQAIFAVLRNEQVALIEAIAQRPQVDSSFLYRKCPEQEQWDFGVDVITRLGFDWKHGRQDRSAHPFTSSLGFGDVRITTRFDPNYLPMALFGSIHECGHALYEQGLAKSLARSPLADGASMAIHESQSRLWENLVGRSRDFWTYFYPRLQEAFPARLETVDLDTFYCGINRVEPSRVRVEADETTYNLHIMLRLELEIGLMEGTINVKSLPEEWNDRVESYLGLAPGSDAEGVLQDIHWSFGGLGYFPTYALGNLVASQLWEQIQKDVPGLDESIRHGEFAPLLGWLRENIHRYGAKYEPQTLVQKVTGSKIDPQPYLRYLRKKFAEIYAL
ncbi:MAG: carboxypeptidase M32 [Anaerolineaceae bacterium]|nr:carboxypeptidase M32 [Anaerolineaceae bacterium]